MDPREFKPIPGTRFTKIAISSLYLLTPLGILIYRFWQGQTPDTLVFIVVLILIFASAYVVYGEKVVDKATEKAKEVSSDEGGE